MSTMKRIVGHPTGSAVKPRNAEAMARLQALLNGFPTSITGGGQAVADYTGTLRKVNTGVPVIEGGLLVENLLLQTATLESSTWAKVSSTTIDVTKYADPTGALTAQHMIPGSGAPAIYQVVAGLIASSTCGLVVWLRGSGSALLSIREGVSPTLASRTIFLTDEWRQYTLKAVKAITSDATRFYIQGVTAESDVYIWRPVALNRSTGLPLTYAYAGDATTTRMMQFIDYKHASPWSNGVAIGDSLTGDWVTNVSRALHISLTNKGVGGNTLAEIAARWQADVLDLSPISVVIEGGINDILVAVSSPVDAMKTSLESMVDSAVATGLDVVLLGLPPFATKVGWTEQRQAWADEYESWLENYAISNGCTFFSLRDVLSADGVTLLAAYDNGDGLHPNANGHIAIAQSVELVLPVVSNDLQPSRQTRTKNGTVKEYVDLPSIQRNTVYTLGIQAVAIASDGVQRYYTVTTAGTSDAVAPTFGTSGTTADNDVVWTYSGYATMNYKRYLGEPARTNLFLNSTVPFTQNITTTAQAYTVSVLGTGTVTLSGVATGEASAGSPLTVTATAGALTCTVAGSPTKVQVEAGAFATSWIDTAGTPVTRPATVNSRSTTNVLRAQNCAVWGLVVPSAAGQVSGFAYCTGPATADSSDVLITSTQVTLRKAITNTAASNYSHAASVPLQYMAAWTDQGMLIRTRAFTGATWGAWSAWATNANTAATPIAATYEIGSRNGTTQFSGNFPELRTSFLPTKATLAEYQTYLENESNWGSPL